MSLVVVRLKPIATCLAIGLGIAAVVAVISTSGRSPGDGLIHASGYATAPDQDRAVLPIVEDQSPSSTGPSPQMVMQEAPIEPNPIQLTLGSTYYVATDGNDGNSGTSEEPFGTIRKGISVLNPGDTLYVRAGIYLQKATLNISRSGAADALITVATAPGEPSRAVISGDLNGNGAADASDTPSNNKYGALIRISGSYVRLENLEVAFSGGNGIRTNANNVISGNSVHDIWTTGIHGYGPGNVIEGNRIWRAAESNFCGGAGGGRGCNGDWTSGIAWGGTEAVRPPGVAPGVVVRGNTVFNTSGEGILCMYSDGGLVEGNTVFDNWGLGIYLDQCSATTIQKNLVYYTGNTSWWRFGNKPGSGILIANESINKLYPIGHDRKVVNNVVVGTGANFDFWHGHAVDSALVNDLIANNTFVEAQRGAAISISSGPHSNTQFMNNIIVQSSGDIAIVGSTVGLTFASNLWSRTPPSRVTSQSDVVGDPAMVDPDHPRDPDAVVADWYKVKANSPAIDRGEEISSLVDDYFGSLRNGPPDLGSSEYRSDEVGRPAT